MNTHTQNRLREAARGFSLIELLIVVAIILIIAGIAIPSILRARMRANDSAAVANIKNIRDSQATYLITYGDRVGYASTLATLGPAGPGAPCTQFSACLLDDLVGCATEPCVKSGYGYFLISSSSSPPFADYTSTATPVGWNSTGQKNVCASEDGILREQVTATASVAAGIPRNTCGDPTQFKPVQ